ncbi:hypothetical protein ACKWTF_015363 [Chironomus riparius]
MIEIDGDQYEVEFRDDLKPAPQPSTTNPQNYLDDFIEVDPNFDDCDSDTSINTTKSALEFGIDEVLNASEVDNLIEQANPEFFNEIDAYEVDIDDIIEEVVDEVYEQPRNPNRKVREVIQVESMPFFCDTCTLDFPSEAYLIRHKRTKKHERALNMETRGKKVNQKRKYVRKNSIKMQQVQVVQVDPNDQFVQNIEAVQNVQPAGNFQLIQNVESVENFELDQFLLPVEDMKPVQIQILPNYQPVIVEDLPDIPVLDDEDFGELFSQQDRNVSMKDFYESFN